DPGTAGQRPLGPAARRRPRRPAPGRHPGPHAVPGRQRPPRPRVAVAVAGGLRRGAGHLRVGRRADGGVPRLRLHLRPGGAARLGGGVRPGAVRHHPRAGGGGSLGERRRLVGRARRQPGNGGVLRPPGPARPALPGLAVRPAGDGGDERRPLRAPRDAAPDPARPGPGLLPVPAARSARGRPGADAVLVGVARRLPGPRLPHPLRVRQPARSGRRPGREGAGLDGPRARRRDGLLRRRQPRRRPDAGQHRLHPPVRPDGLLRPAADGLAAGVPGRRPRAAGAGRAAGRPPRRPAAPRPRVLLGPLRDQGVAAPGPARRARRRAVGRRRRAPRRAALPARAADRSLAADPLQPVPRRAARFGHRDRLRRRPRPARRGDGDRQAAGGPGAQRAGPAGRRAVRGRHPAGAGLQPAPLGGQHRRGDDLRRPAVRRPGGGRGRPGGRLPAEAVHLHHRRPLPGRRRLP
ncbi:MAG: GH38, partial [uncultured Friedmanniella sp.]